MKCFLDFMKLWVIVLLHYVMPVRQRQINMLSCLYKEVNLCFGGLLEFGGDKENQLEQYGQAGFLPKRERYTMKFKRLLKWARAGPDFT
ncbi:hypothetical protein HOO54_20490 [Bacillus sp. WMMC1349]|uniref:hypothetical protein n=1 Tax=Bacillus sp. WMMC1349 TaxID=2736254 RepID=UPI0015526F75|nr:hypothetical protein [Bacillus sp. WMMC1349]NPC94537.1 hypothetical protein [Bacillus sp. WMMC1349]